MPFFFLGIILVITSIFFLRRAKKGHDKEGIVGAAAMLMAGLIMILFFGIYYSLLLP